MTAMCITLPHCLFVCLLHKTTKTDFYKIWKKIGTWATEEPLASDDNLDNVMLGLGLELGLG